jgi:hypothetical protein
MDTTKIENDQPLTQPEETASTNTGADEATTTGDPAGDTGTEAATDSAAGAEGAAAFEETTAEAGEVTASDKTAGSESDIDGAEPVVAPRQGVLSATASVVAAALGFVSLSGTWLGTQLAERQELAGQIQAQSGTSRNPVVDVYATPWHTTALVNGLFALLAILVGAAVLLFPQFEARTPGTRWVRAIATGAMVLGVIGVLIAVAMRFDLFTGLPALPSPRAEG